MEEWICWALAFVYVATLVAVNTFDQQRRAKQVRRLTRERDALLDVLRNDYGVEVTFLDQPPTDGEREHWAPDSDAVH